MKIFLQIHRLKSSDKPNVIIRMYSEFSSFYTDLPVKEILFETVTCKWKKKIKHVGHRTAIHSQYFVLSCISSTN